MFEGCVSLTNVLIPNSITKIENPTFTDCENLTRVNLLNSITEIGYAAFQRCKKLASINIPSLVQEIGTYAFSLCSSLQNISLPNSLKSIAMAAFLVCTMLKDVYYRGTEEEWKATTIKESNNESLFHATMHYSEDILFSGICGENLAWTLDDFGILTISGIGKMTNYYVLSKPWNKTDRPRPDNTHGNSETQIVKIGDAVTSIGESAFFYCTNLTSVIISDSIETSVQVLRQPDRCLLRWNRGTAEGD